MAGQYMSAALMGTKKLRANLQKHEQEIDARAVRWTLKWLMILKKRSKGRLTYNKLDGVSGGRDMGILAKSLAHQITYRQRGIIQGRWGTGLDYGPYVESGTREHFLPFEFFPEIERWARRHGLPVDNMWGMTVGGKDSGHPYLKPVAEEAKDEMKWDFMIEFGVK